MPCLDLMPFDGFFLHCICGEINAARDAHIYKIYQPSREELVLALRKKDFNKKLLISVKGGMARIQFTDNAPENPDTPPMFCMLLRKHLSAARFEGVTLFGFERVARLCFTSANEMGDKVSVDIVCELIGNSANAVLVDADGRVIDAVRRGSIEAGGRLIVPGAVYEYPERQDKLDICTDGPACIAQSAAQNGGRLSEALLSRTDGMSPLIARETVYRAFGDDISAGAADKGKLENTLELLRSAIESGGTPCLLSDKSGAPKDFSFVNIKQYGGFYKTAEFESFSALLDTFYFERERASMKKRAGGDLEKLLKTLLSRTERRMNLRKKELAAASDRDKLLLYGELLKANIHLVKPGDRKVRVRNYYDENGGYADIPLDPALGAAANASRYFKDYKKSRNAEISLAALIEKDEEESVYLESVLDSLGRAQTLTDIAEIREELAGGGYIKTAKNARKQKKKPAEPLTLTSKEGYRILVGKNNLQNDRITTVLAAKNDMWFHVKNIPGSHVVVQCGGAPLSEETVKLAATLAAKNSKAAASGNVPVDYTPVKYVKKPSGAKAGMVIYTTNKTLYITPGEDQ